MTDSKQVGLRLHTAIFGADGILSYGVSADQKIEAARMVDELIAAVVVDTIERCYDVDDSGFREEVKKLRAAYESRWIERAAWLEAYESRWIERAAWLEARGIESKEPVS